MLKILVLIVSVSLFAINFASAKELPIEENIKIIIPPKKTILFEFPFEIKVNKKPFYSVKVKKRKKVNLEKVIDRPNLNDINSSLNPKSNISTSNGLSARKKGSSFSVKNSKNIIELFSKKEGKTELIVFGYKHPIIINIEVAKNETAAEIDRYYKFKDLTKKKENAIKFESEPHERNLRRILVALYKDEPPKGYKVEYASLSKKKNGLIEKLEKRIIGYNYIGEVWSVQNIEEGIVHLYEESYLNESIYLVSLEADTLENGEITRMFIIRDKQ